MQKIAQYLCLPAMLMACAPTPGHANAPTTPIEAASFATQAVAKGAVATQAIWQAPKTLHISLNSSNIALPPCHPDAASTPKPHPSLNVRMEAQRRQHWPVVVAAACSVGIPIKLLDALIIQESKYNQAAVSTAGAAGLTQLMPQTAAALGVRNRFSAHESIWGGSRYLKSLLQRFGRLELALAAYNLGPSALASSSAPPRQGSAFAAQVMRHAQQSAHSGASAVTLALPVPALDDGFAALASLDIQPHTQTALIQTPE